MEEIVIAGLIAIWIVLYQIEDSAYKKAAISKYAWIARAIRWLILFGGPGLFLVIIGTDWNTPLIEKAIGGIFIIIGIIKFITTAFKRKQIQEGLETGKIEPIAGEG